MFQLKQLRARRALTRGYSAWVAGDLDGALRHLDTSLAWKPALRGALLYKARVLSEQGKRGEAAAALDAAGGAQGHGPAGAAAAVFRAIVLYDQGEGKAARETAAPLERSNALAAAVADLLGLRDALGAAAPPAPGANLPAAFPLPARWLADGMGRSLALVEGTFLSRSFEEAIELNHRYLTGEEPRDPKEPAEKPGKVARRATFGSRKEWEDLADSAFRRRDYAAVEDLCGRKDVPSDWLGLQASIYRAYSLLALDRGARALQILSKAAPADRVPADIHFLRGLCLARAGDLAEAGWAFTRAVRSVDILGDEILQEVSRRLGIEWTFEDL